MELFQVYESTGSYFRAISEAEAQMMLDQRAVIVDRKRKRIRLRLTVDRSTAHKMLSPRFPLAQGSKTTRIESVGLNETPLFQHHERRCLQWLL